MASEIYLPVVRDVPLYQFYFLLTLFRIFYYVTMIMTTTIMMVVVMMIMGQPQ